MLCTVTPVDDQIEQQDRQHQHDEFVLSAPEIGQRSVRNAPISDDALGQRE